ncbi:MAG: sigma-70 family RNA polymerase sigma factor [Acidimicrobiia bacterium]|nr:sigma-70 family RNA polymerase sigma factor [Acidimicrobiia bacterium]
MRRTSRLPRAQIDRFKRLCWPAVSALLRSARFLTWSEDDAEDLVQDTMMKALRAIDSFEEGSDVRAWLMTIMRRTQIDRIRAQGRRIECLPLEDDVAVDRSGQYPALELDKDWGDPEALLEQFEDADIVTALRSLPDAIRWTLLLVDVEGLGHEQAAGILGVPEGTVKSRAYRGRRMLCATLGESGKPVKREVSAGE